MCLFHTYRQSEDDLMGQRTREVVSGSGAAFGSVTLLPGGVEVRSAGFGRAGADAAAHEHPPVDRIVLQEEVSCLLSVCAVWGACNRPLFILLSRSVLMGSGNLKASERNCKQAIDAYDQFQGQASLSQTPKRDVKKRLNLDVLAISALTGYAQLLFLLGCSEDLAGEEAARHNCSDKDLAVLGKGDLQQALEISEELFHSGKAKFPAGTVVAGLAAQTALPTHAEQKVIFFSDSARSAVTMLIFFLILQPLQTTRKQHLHVLALFPNVHPVDGLEHVTQVVPGLGAP
ncbi:hypothetical protein BBJ28_00022874 [Nothophytophthora sp. Chile5]|nr:hypothetical protein BBJ28_00022874 [Nothophytophthora sp. Chile5]